MKNTKTVYLIYAIVAVLIIAAVIVALSAGKSDSVDNTRTTDTENTNSAPATTTGAEVTTAVPVTTAPVVTTAPEATTETPATTAPEATTETPATTAPEATTETPATTEPEATTETPATTAPEATTEAPVTTAPDVTPETPATTAPEVATEAPATTEPEVTEPLEVITEPEVTDPLPEGSFTFTLSFAGDTQLADNYNSTAKNFASIWETVEPSHYLSKVRSIFEADDYSLLNLEFVLSDRDLDRSYKSGTAFWYKGPTKYIQALTSSSIEGLALTNNHTGDYGDEGEADTLACVLSSGFDAGTYTDTIYVTKNGYTVAIICDAMWWYEHEYDIIPRIKEAEAKSDFQVVYWHGGSAEYQLYPDEWEKQACYDLVDAGADLVIGNHPHVLQPMEYYKGVRILYSLGNFCYSGMCINNNVTVIYQLELTVSKDGVLLDAGENIIPCYYWNGYLQNPITGEWTQNYRPEPITDATALQKVWDFLDWKTDTPSLQ